MSLHAADIPRYELASFSLSSVLRLSAELRTLHENARSMEDVAVRVVRTLRERFIDEQGQPAHVLVRFYKTVFLADLDDRIRSIAHRVLRDVPPNPAMRCLTLLGTAGSKREWNERTESRDHQCIPLPSSEQVGSMPMIAQLMRQLGVNLATFDGRASGMLTDLDQRHLHNVFYVPEAVGNPCIPDQQDFVIPNGIRSVIGFGGTLPDQQMFAVIAFARSHVSREVAAWFGPLSVSTKLAVMHFYRPEETFRKDEHRPLGARRDAEFLTSKIESLEQLMEVYVETVKKHADGMERVQADLHQRALVDPVTGLANRRAFDDRFALEWGHSLRNGQALSMLLVDVDHFKQYNDCLGHLAGDDCLRRIAERLARSVHRSTDIVARFGGEEFAVLLPETSLTNAAAVAEGIRAAVQEPLIPHPTSRVASHVTVSVGVASMVADRAMHMAALIHSADIALYRAKAAGRNRVSVAG
jgi:diguanylate cyclase (GGDEF)-like protein